MVLGVEDYGVGHTPLSYRTNRIIGGVAPSEYLAKLEKGTGDNPAIDRKRLDGFLSSHLIDPQLLRADGFDAFMADRQARLLKLIEQATGKEAYAGAVPEEGEDAGDDADAIEEEKTIAAT